MDTFRSSRLRHQAFRRSLKPDRKTGDGGAGPDKTAGRQRSHLREYRAWLRPYRRTLAFVFILALLAAALNMVLPMVTRFMIDRVLLHSSLADAERLRLLAYAGLGMVVLLILAQGMESLRAIRMAVLNAKVVFQLRRRLFERLLHLPLGRLAEMKSGGIVARLSGDVDRVTGLVQMAVITPGVAIIRIILSIGVLIFLSWKMAMAASALIPPIVLINLMWVRRVRPIYRSMRDDRAEVDGRVTETFGGIRVVRAFRREGKEEHDYAVRHHTIIRKRLYAQILQLVVTSGWGLAIPATSLVIVWFGGYLVIHNQASIGDIFAFQMYAFMLLSPVSQIVNSWNETQSALAAMERVFEILDMDPEKPDAPDAIDAPPVVEDIEFDNVGFGYRPDRSVLTGITFRVPGGSVVALVGVSGSGKTTLTDLIARFYDPTRGAIRINGIDIRRFKLRGYRSLLAVVQQDVFLFDGTVRENIRYGRRGADDIAIIDAARRANAHAFIEALPEGYDTLIGERGVKLSGGQRQRISIARAILADPQILILDEATSNLDTESEQLIQASLAELLSGRTTFVIAHRLSTVTHADIIVVLDAGRIIEIGDHETLMRAGGPYYEMVERQREFATTSIRSLG